MPPTTFFTMTVAFSRFSRACAMMRAVRSVEAPGAFGLISEISRAGHLLDWPIAGAATVMAASAVPPFNTLLRFMLFSSLDFISGDSACRARDRSREACRYANLYGAARTSAERSQMLGCSRLVYPDTKRFGCPVFTS